MEKAKKKNRKEECGNAGVWKKEPQSHDIQENKKWKKRFKKKKNEKKKKKKHSLSEYK